MIILLVLSIILNLVLGYLVYINAKKTNIYEEWISELKQLAYDAYLTMRALDIRGAFEADDQVGMAFKGIKGIVTHIASKAIKQIQEIEDANKEKDSNSQQSAV